MSKINNEHIAIVTILGAILILAAALGVSYAFLGMSIMLLEVAAG
jgi:hypothetical protein